MASENFTVDDIGSEHLIKNVLAHVEKQFVELDGYYELFNVGRENPVSKEEFVGLIVK